MNRYKALRFERGLTIADVARGAGLSHPTVKRLDELDEGEEITAPTAKALADFYGVTVAELLGVTTTTEQAA